MTAQTPRTSNGGRGQTTIDFAIGMSVFLITLAFVLSFSTGLTDPFADTGQAHTITADRVAESLAGGMLGPREQPHLLDDTCTTDFFDPSDENTDNDGSYSLSSNCNFKDVPLKPRIGLQGRPAGTEPEVNITLSGNATGPDGTDLLCWDGTNDAVVEVDDNECGGVRYAIGSTPPKGSGSVVVARRVVTINGVQATLQVRVWSG